MNRLFMTYREVATALMSVGIEQALDAVGHYLPPPVIPEAWQGHPGLGFVVKSSEQDDGAPGWSPLFAVTLVMVNVRGPPTSSTASSWSDEGTIESVRSMSDHDLQLGGSFG